ARELPRVGVRDAAPARRGGGADGLLPALARRRPRGARGRGLRRDLDRREGVHPQGRTRGERQEAARRVAAVRGVGRRMGLGDRGPDRSCAMKVGIDLVDVSRIAASIDAFGDRFLRRVFTEGEIAYARSAPALTAERLAARFAAKEAAKKALELEGVAW